MKMSNF